MAARTQSHSTHTRSAALDGLRGVAVLMVFVFHYGGGLKSPNAAVRLLGYATEAGWTGVTLFFALSGFLITGILWDSRGQRNLLRNFYARRALRILPLYYGALLLAALVLIARGTVADTQHLWIHIFFLQNLLFLVDITNNSANQLPLYHLWSLAVEEQFYLLWPALLLLAHSRRAALKLCLWSFVVTEVFRLVVYGAPDHVGHHLFDPHLFDWFLLTQAGALALGGALALALREDAGKRWVEHWAMVAFFSGTLVYLLTSWVAGTFYLTPRLQFMAGLAGVSVAVTAVIPLALRTGWLHRALSSAPLCWLGRISYGFYVFHILLQPLYDTLSTHLAHSTVGSTYQLARFFVALMGTTVVAGLSYYFVEMPFLHWKRHFPLHSALPEKL